MKTKNSNFTLKTINSNIINNAEVVITLELKLPLLQMQGLVEQQ